MAATHTVQQLAKIAGDFVVKHHGVWEHEQWESLCRDAAVLGLELDADMQAQLGELLERLRVFYFCMPAAPLTQSKAKAKAKAKAKPKAKPKSAPSKGAADGDEAS